MLPFLVDAAPGSNLHQGEEDMFFFLHVAPFVIDKKKKGKENKENVEKSFVL